MYIVSAIFLNVCVCVLQSPHLLLAYTSIAASSDVPFVWGGLAPAKKNESMPLWPLEELLEVCFFLV